MRDSMRFALLLTLLLTGCGLLPQRMPPPPPSVERATAHLDLVIAAGVAHDFERLCALATGTCDGELGGFEHLAPTERPDVAEVTVHEPTQSGSGGVLFVLCGEDAMGTPFESEVLVFDAGDQLLAAAAVFWKGTGIVFTGDDGFVDVGGVPEPDEGPARC
jgi:hypothetical protein